MRRGGLGRLSIIRTNCHQYHDGGCLKRLYTFLSVGAVLIIPHFWLDATIDPGLVPRFLLLALILLVTITTLTAFIIRNRFALDISILRRAIFSVLLGSIIVAGISLIGTVNLAEGVFDFLRLSMFIILIFTTTLIMANSPNYLEVITRTFVLAGISLSIIGGMQYFRLAFIFWDGNPIPYGTIANKNLYASALYLTLPFVWYQTAVSRGKWKWMHRWHNSRRN